MWRLKYAALALLLSSCSTSYSIKGADGSMVTGSMVNGAASYSSGTGCSAAAPNPLVPPPMTPPALVLKRICGVSSIVGTDNQGTSCVNLMVQDTAPVCSTQVVNVRGNDISSYFGWLFAALGAAAIAVASGT